MHDDDPGLTDLVFQPHLAPERVTLAEVSRRYRKEFTDVANDPERSRLAWAGINAALDMGYPVHEAVPIAARLARKADIAPATDSPAARSRAIAEIAAGRGQR